MRFLKISWVVVVTLVRFGGVALSLFLLLISGMLRLLAGAVGTEDPDDGKWPEIVAMSSDDDCDNPNGFTVRQPRVF